MEKEKDPHYVECPICKKEVYCPFLSWLDTSRGFTCPVCGTIIKNEGNKP